MIHFLVHYQVYILLSCAFSSLLLAIFTMIIKFHSLKSKLALTKFNVGMSILLFTDACLYMFKGQRNPYAYWGARVSAFFLYICTAAIIYFLCQYITTTFMESGKFERPPKRLLLGFILPSMAMTIVVISQFTGITYYFDENNILIHGKLYPVSFVLLFASVIFLMTFVGQYRTIIKKRLFSSFLTFSILPMASAVAQQFMTGVSLMNLTIWITSVILFACVLSAQNDELAKAANTDFVTGFPNTFGYFRALEKKVIFGDSVQYNSYYFDIVRMSHINNKYGNKIGDYVIIQYANNIKASLDDGEVIGRLGGNFFVALIKKTNTEKFLDMLMDVPVEFEFMGKNETVHIAAIAGGYKIGIKDKIPEHIISYTATALSYAKNVAHKPFVFLDEELEKKIEHERTVEIETRAALDKGEFEPFFQPKVNTKDNTLCGAEALIRWRKDGKLIPPMEFIPIMERNTTICELDFYNLEYVCKNIKEWISKGIKPVPVSVNFSRKNLGNPILAEAISKVVEKYDIPKDLIQIEITETLDEFPMSYLVGVVEALQRYGHTVAIDDFGTGSSSINLLMAVKFDVLKIDKSFVDYKSQKDKKILEDIIHMADDIGISVIAEGVEDMKRVEELKDMNCFAVQGYVFDRPLEKSEFEKKLINTKY